MYNFNGPVINMKFNPIENVTLLWDSIKVNLIFVLEFVGIVVLIMLIAFIAETILKKKYKDKDKILTTRKIAVIGIFGAMAGIFMTLELPIPGLIPETHKFEIGDLPALISGFAFGPVAGVLVEFIKVFMKTLLKPTQTAFVGELANFIIGNTLVLPATIIYWCKKTKKTALISVIIGSLIMIVFGTAFNAFYLIPKFIQIFGGNAQLVIDSAAEVNPLITNVGTYAIFAAGPINILKSASVSVLAMVLYKPLSAIWKNK